MTTTLPSHNLVNPPSKVLSRKLYLPAIRAGDPLPPKIVSVDLQPMAPIEGVTQLQGDITSEETATAVSLVDQIEARFASFYSLDHTSLSRLSIIMKCRGRED
jgi:hypothetical protein